MILKKALLLNDNYEALSFINQRRIVKFLIKDKVDVISLWEEDITWGNGKIPYPAILRLKNHIKRSYFGTVFSRRALLKRDKNTCQYCAKKLTPSQITIDHVIPRAQKGLTTFDNCVVSCYLCNSKKSNKTPEQAGMVLLKKPNNPYLLTNIFLDDPQDHWHDSWNDYLN